MADYAEGDTRHKDPVTEHNSNQLQNSSTVSGFPDDGCRQCATADEVTCHAAELVGNILREELRRSASNVVKRDVTRTKNKIEFPFNRHTVTIAIGDEVVDFTQTVRDLPRTQKTQIWVAKEIEKVRKGQVKKHKQSEDNWKKDFKDKRYCNDLTYAEILAKGFGDTVSNPYTCMCELSEPGDGPGDMVCYNCYNADDNDIITSPYVFNSTITPYPLVYSSSLPDVDI